MDKSFTAQHADAVSRAKEALDLLISAIDLGAAKYPRKIGKIAGKSVSKLAIIPAAGILIDLCVEYLEEDLIKDAKTIIEGEEVIADKYRAFDKALADAKLLLAKPASNNASAFQRDAALCRNRIIRTSAELINSLEKVGTATLRFKNAHFKEIEKLDMIANATFNDMKTGKASRQLKDLLARLGTIPTSPESMGGRRPMDFK